MRDGAGRGGVHAKANATLMAANVATDQPAREPEYTINADMMAPMRTATVSTAALPTNFSTLHGLVPPENSASVSRKDCGRFSALGRAFRRKAGFPLAQ
jgi:hypothetical protein